MTKESRRDPRSTPCYDFSMGATDHARALLEEHADAQRADGKRKYLKSPFVVLGIPKGDVNTIGTALSRHLKDAGPEELLSVLDEWWRSGVHEEMSLAIVVAAELVRKLHVEDVGGIFSRWIDECRTWDHLDELCIRVTGMLVIEDSSAWPVIERWATSPHMWKRRASLVSHLPSIRAQRPEVELLERTCRILASEQAFFIRKAIGWVLRELADHDLNAMVSLFRPIREELSGLSRREATRKLDPDVRAFLLDGKPR